MNTSTAVRAGGFRAWGAPLTHRNILVDAGAVVALIGLIFGFVTWRATQAETKSAVLLADRERVADLALELSTIPLDELEATSTWGASTASTVSAHLNARQVQVIQQMLEVIERADREIATASQQVALADALVRTGEHAAAVDHYDRALRLSDSFGLAVHALRGKAAALHQMNVISDARAAWEEAVQIADDYRLPKDFVVLSEIQTLSNWGSWEALTGECDRARRMRARTTELAETLMRLTTGNKAYAARVTQLQQPLVDALRSCASQHGTAGSCSATIRGSSRGLSGTEPHRKDDMCRDPLRLKDVRILMA